MDMDMYMASDSTYRHLINANFDEITVGYAMKHGAMVNSKGVINFTNVDALIAKVKSAGLTVYGHTLVWHSNQNATYLNGLIAPAVSYTNLLSNGTFESGISGWGAYNGNAPTATTTSYAGSGAMQVINATSNAGSQWKQQIHANLTTTLTSGSVYTVSYYIRSDAAGSVRCSTSGGTAHYQADQTTSTNWTLISWDITSNGAETGLNFDLGQVAGTYYIDNVLVALKSSPTVDKTDAEKKQIIGDALTAWITGMVTHFKSSIKAWDVVNEPMNEDGTVRDGSAATTASDQFYWQKYLGKDYAVTAFKLARTLGNTGDKLFINDYNLESNLTKCDGLINYVKYIESQGATVDGIGTQMHISISTDTLKIDQMFIKLAASGKLIKVSELDVKVNTATPTTDNLAAQAAMYQYVAKSFIKNIPKAQRYGITIWGISDNAVEHVNWIPNDAPNLWDANYARKHAYKGVADGLAGKDVSAGFSGNLQY
jgi:GH35 family endo-1,4-beta-xylanase